MSSESHPATPYIEEPPPAYSNVEGCVVCSWVTSQLAGVSQVETRHEIFEL